MIDIIIIQLTVNIIYTKPFQAYVSVFRLLSSTSILFVFVAAVVNQQQR